MQCRIGAQFRRSLLFGSALLLTVWIVGCPVADTGGGAGDQPVDAGGGSAGQPVPTPDRQIEVIIDPAAGGTVTQTSSGNIVTLTAVPEDGWAFSAWFDSTSSTETPRTISTENPLTILANDNTSIGARFTLLQVDTDGDGVPDGADVCPGFDDKTDSDRDSVPDGCDRCDGEDDRDDQDGDGKPDECDGCPNTVTDDDTNDADDDGIPDGCDDCPNDANNDADGDGVCEPDDQCLDTEADAVVNEQGCTPPDNDLCANAQDVSDGNTAFDTEHASTDDLGASPTCSGDSTIDVINDPTKDVWYCYTATCNGLATADVCDGNFDTVLAVYDGCVCPPTNLITCGDDECGTRSRANFDVIEGSTYLVRVGGFNDVGTGTLLIGCDSTCTSDADCNDTNPCTDDSCDPSHAQADGEGCVNIPNSASCSDDNPCTVNDVCSGGTCVSGTAPDCSGAGDQCNVATCSPSGSDGNCDTLMPINEGAPCDDGNVCTLGETCQSGSCAGGSPPDCSAAGDQCNAAECSTVGAEGNCDTLVPLIDGTPCDNGMACMINDICQSGVCQGIDPPDCSTAGDQCNTATCDPAGAEGNCDTLVPLLDGTLCDDGIFCNGTDSCFDGSCSDHAGDPCPLGLLCLDDNCVECINFQDCDDGISCTRDLCSNNVCVFEPIDGGCPDGDLCTDDVCDPVNGCQNPPIVCGENEECNPNTGVCGPIPCTDAVDCDDGNACTTDACVAGVCERTAVVCDDGVFCNGLETCDDALGCQDGMPPSDDGVLCTDDACDELAQSWTNTPNDANCDDGLFCNGLETCDPARDCLIGTNPCPPGQTCDESTQNCVGAPTVWNSTQLLRPNTLVFAPPETYHLDNVGRLTTADLGVTTATLTAAFPDADEITILSASAVPGVTTQLFTVFTDLGGGLTETTTLDLTINTFDLSITTQGESLVATWTFDYTFMSQSCCGLGNGQETKHFAGTQTGDVSPDGSTITWTAVSGIVQTCNPLNPQQPCMGICINNTCLGFNPGQACSTNTDCDIQLNGTNFPLGTWTTQ